jgi:hypothetical protein
MVATENTMSIIVFRDVEPCDLVEVYQHFYPADEGCKLTKAQAVYFDHSTWHHTIMEITTNI